MMAAGVVPLATAYSISEALGFEKGVSNTFREAPTFLGYFYVFGRARRSDWHAARPANNPRTSNYAGHQRRSSCPSF
jgi:hypothetical protein